VYAWHRPWYRLTLVLCIALAILASHRLRCLAPGMPTSCPPHPPTTSTQTSYGVLSHSHKHISIAIYPSLSSSAPHSPQEKHFEQSHHPCLNPICQACKFVVFGSQIDLQAHMVEEHGAEMSSRDKKDARRVNAAFEFTSSSSNVHHGGGPGGDSGDGSGAGHEQGQRDSQLQPPSAPRPIFSLENRRSLFGAHLTSERDANDGSPGPSRHQTPSLPPPSMDPVTTGYVSSLFSHVSARCPS